MYSVVIGDKEIIPSENIQVVLNKNPKMWDFLKELYNSQNYQDDKILDTLLDDIFISLNNSNFLDKTDICVYIVMYLFDILKSNNFREGLILQDTIIVIKKALVNTAERSSYEFINYKMKKDSSIELLKNVLIKDGIVVSNNVRKRIIKYMDRIGTDAEIAISNAILNNIESFDKETKKKIMVLIEDIMQTIVCSYKINSIVFKETLSIYDFVMFLLSDNFINGKINIRQLEIFSELIKKRNKNDEISEIVNDFLRILDSKNYGKGIIPDEYLGLFLDINVKDDDNFIQRKVLTELLTSECYEEGFITKDNLELIVNKEYRAITSMIYYFVTSRSELRLDDRYNWILGIFEINNKKEQCQIFEKCVKGTVTICDVTSKWIEYNLLFPKLDVKPVERRREK